MNGRTGTILRVAALLAALAQATCPAQEPSSDSPASAATACGEPVEGVSLRLEATRTRWGAGESPALSLDVQNQGQRDFLILQTPEFLGNLEVDGIRYRWCGSGSFAQSPLPPGRRYEGIPLILTPTWRPDQDKAVTRQSRPILPLQFSAGQHTIRFSMTCRDAHAPSAKTVRKPGEPSPEVVVTSNPVRIEVTATNEEPTAVAAPWGRATNGFAVQLRAEHSAWTTEDTVNLAVAVRNQGQRNLLVPQAQQLGELEVDGVYYHWAGPIGTQSSVLPPSYHATNIPVNLTTNWQTQEGKLLQLGPTWHTVRFVVSALPNQPTRSPPIRAVSNPVQFNVVPGVGERAALVNKFLPGYALRAVRHGSGYHESFTEVLATPDGKEIDLSAARGWRGTTGVLRPLNSPGAASFQSPTWWRNARLTALAPSLKLKVASAQEAEDIARIVLGIFKGPGCLEHHAFKAERGENGWVVTPSYVGPPAQVMYQGPLELILKDGLLWDVREQAGFGRPSLAPSPANPAEPGWGEPVEGLSVRLQSDKPVLLLYQGIDLRLSVRNLGSETFRVPESQELGELEIDGVWHRFDRSDPYYVALKPLAPGRQFDNIAVQPTANWRSGSSRILPQVGTHKIRFAVLARREGPNREQPVRVVSNPLEVEFQR